MTARRRRESAARTSAPHSSRRPAPTTMREPWSSSASVRRAAALTDAPLPGDFAGARAPVRHAGEHEEQVREPVEIDDHNLRHRILLLVTLQPDDRTLCAPAHRARDVERGRLGGAAGQNERLERFALQLTVVSGLLELPDACAGDPCLLELLLVLFGMRCGQERADRQEIALDGSEDFIDARHHFDAACDADPGVELVHVAIRFDADVVLGHATAAEEAGAAVVAGLGVDLRGHGWNLHVFCDLSRQKQCRIPWTRAICPCLPPSKGRSALFRSAADRKRRTPSRGVPAADPASLAPSAWRTIRRARARTWRRSGAAWRPWRSPA